VKSMRILVLDNQPLRRGAQLFARQLVEGLNSRGHEATLVYLYRVKKEGGPELMEGVRLHGDASHLFERLLTVHPGLIWRLIMELRRQRPDVVLCNGSGALKYGAWARRWLGEGPRFIGRLIDRVSYWNQTPAGRWYHARWVVPAFDAWVAVSRDAREDFLSVFQATTPVVHIPRAVTEDHDNIWSGESGPSPSCAEVLLFAGAFTDQKDPVAFVELVSRVRRSCPQVKAVMAGDGPLEEGVRSRIRLLGLEGVVRLTGVLTDLNQLYRTSALLVLTSRTEGIPGVVLEAALNGLPAVAYRVGGLHECIRHGETGFLVEPGDRQSMADAITKLLKGTPARVELGRQARAFVLEEFPMSLVLTKFEVLFRQLVTADDQSGAPQDPMP